MKSNNQPFTTANPSCCSLGYAYIWLVALLLTTLSAAAQTGGALLTDTLSIRFRMDSTRVDLAFDGNDLRWATFEENFYRRYANVQPGALRLDIYAGASPEGTAAHNRWLGENRGLSIRRLARQRLGRAVGSIVVHNEAARWDGFYDLVADSHEPWRDEVLRIIEMPASPDENKRDQRETLLRALRGGSVWPVLRDKYLAPLRSGATAILSWQAGRDTIVIRDTVVVVKAYEGTPATIVAPVAPAASESAAAAAAARRDSLLFERLQYPAWAVKTNFLLWGVVAPNIQVEIPLGRHNHWSLELEYFAPWFTWSHNARASQFHNVGIELRCYLGNRTYHPWLHGWHLGLAAAGGYYDWEWKKHEGYQGEYINAYLNIGYQHRWGMHWALDCALGFGAMATKYRHYYGGSVYPEGHLEEQDDHLIWHDTGHYLWPGPCHASLSLVYMFNAWPFHTKSRKLKGL